MNAEGEPCYAVLPDK